MSKARVVNKARRRASVVRKSWSSTQSNEDKELRLNQRTKEFYEYEFLPFKEWVESEIAALWSAISSAQAAESDASESGGEQGQDNGADDQVDGDVDIVNGNNGQ